MIAKTKPLETKGVTWDFDGTRLLPREIADLLFAGGFVGLDALIKATAIVLAESEGWTQAWHKNIDEDTGETLSTDYLFPQINDKAWPRILEIKDLPDTRETWVQVAKFMHDIYKVKGFQPWAARDLAMDPKHPRKYLPRAINGVCNWLKTRYDLPLVH